MSRRNPMNDRYVMEKDKQGVSRKSASNMKPKSRAGESTNYVSSGGGQKKRGLFGRSRSRTEEKESKAKELESLGPNARDRKLREEYNKWDVWRRRLVIIAFVLMFIALSYPFTILEETDQTRITSTILWVLPFVAIGVGIYISYAKQRPLGRILGIGYGADAADERAKVKSRREQQRRDYNKQEQKVAARVEDKERKSQEREERRKANRAAEEARKQQYRDAGQAKNKK